MVSFGTPETVFNPWARSKTRPSAARCARPRLCSALVRSLFAIVSLLPPYRPLPDRPHGQQHRQQADRNRDAARLRCSGRQTLLGWRPAPAAAPASASAASRRRRSSSAAIEA